MSIDDGGALLQGVRSAQGIALMRWSLVASELQAGRLVRAMPALLPMDEGYWYVEAGKPPTANLALFRDWLLEQARQFEGPQQAMDGLRRNS